MYTSPWLHEKMLFLECLLPSWLPWQWNAKDQSKHSNEVT